MIYNPMAKNGEGQGLYLETSVTMLSELDEINNALDLLGKRRGKPFGFVEKFTGNGSQRIYKATPEKMWINDADQDADGDFIRDYRIEVQNFRET